MFNERLIQGQKLHLISYNHYIIHCINNVTVEYSETSYKVNFLCVKNTHRVFITKKICAESKY